MRIALQPAFLLHRKPYRDSSRIYDFFTLDHGVISLMAKSVWRKEKGGSLASLIQPFTPLLISFVGRASLKTLSKVELADNHKNLTGERIFCALYLNELLLKLVGRNIPYPELFGYYSTSLDALKIATYVEEPLRSFELFLLAELGYEIDLETDWIMFEDESSISKLQRGICYSGFGSGYTLEEVDREFRSEVENMPNYQLHETYSYLAFERMLPRTRFMLVGFEWEKFDYHVIGSQEMTSPAVVVNKVVEQLT